MQHSPVFTLYTEQDVSAREIQLKFTRKRGSTTAEQADLPINRAKRHIFWTMPHPFGINGTPRGAFIDIDECGIWLEKHNRTMGKAPRGVRVRSPGPYGHGTEFTIILAISPCGKLWYQMLDVAGTSTAMFLSFVSRVLSRLPVGGPATRTFLWDNLTSHKSAVVFNTVTAAGHLRPHRRHVERLPSDPSEARPIPGRHPDCIPHEPPLAPKHLLRPS
eukprot:m.356846 g.356846  ORF g.356846 m.356846 type:complete len:218 (+) comp16607_c0_seq17:470-1123(+)